MTGFSVPARFSGPADAANGGWISGMAASFLPQGGTIEVTLRRPTPLGTPLDVEVTGERARLLAGGETLVEAVVTGDDPVPPPFVSAEEAEKAEQAYPGLTDHPLPDCYVCGLREPGEGLRVWPGPTGRADIVASRWHAHPLLSEWADTVPAAHVWAALDCVTGWAHAEPGWLALLGRLTVRLHHAVVPGKDYVVVGRREGRERRKLHSSGAIYTTDGLLVGASRATWISMR